MHETENKKQKQYTIFEFRREVGVPLVLAKRLISWGEVKSEKITDGTFRVTEEEIIRIKEVLKNPRKKIKYYIQAIGPGVITGASDDDPSGIGTYSSAGAKFGLALLWMTLWLLPVMMAMQEICARIGIVTNKGLAGILQKYYSRKIVLSAVLLLLVANIVNIGADLSAMAASLQMVSGLNFYIGAVGFAVILILLEIFVQYHVYVKIFKWLTLSLFAYVITAFIIHPNWLAVLKDVFIPHISFSKEYLFAAVAVFGTTISPYLFFWQTSEEVEDNNIKSYAASLKWRIKKMRTDVSMGMVFSNIVAFFIIITTAQVLFQNGITNISSAHEAAQALRPLAGDYAYFLFAFGIIGTGLLAIPILAGSSAYALSELFQWKESLELKFSQAKGFYLVIAFSIIIGLIINFLGVNPIASLYYAAFLNGMIALPLMIIIMIVGNNKKIMDGETHPLWVKIFGWLGVIFMTGAVVATITLQV